MAGRLRHVPLKPDTDLRRILEEVHRDRVPRLIERDGEPLALVISPEDYPSTRAEPKSKRYKEELLALAGVWSGLDADRLIEYVYQARRDTPPSPSSEPLEG